MEKATRYVVSRAGGLEVEKGNKRKVLKRDSLPVTGYISIGMSYIA